MPKMTKPTATARPVPPPAPRAPIELCGHTYKTREQRIFSCTKTPHPSRPGEHYFQRDHDAEARAVRVPFGAHRNLILIPGARREEETTDA